MNKIIFLDFDGVLNSVGTKDRFTHPAFGHKIRGLDGFRVELVSKLALETGAKIVISSTWREFLDFDQLKDLLASKGMKAEIVGVTPRAYKEIGLGFPKMRLDRGDEIQAWIDNNGKPDAFLVLDDLPTQFRHNQVKTDDATGFFAGHMKRAKRILNGEIDASREG